jgi:hypothetical protein
MTWPVRPESLSLYQWKDRVYVSQIYLAKMKLVLILSKFSSRVGPKPKLFVFHSTIWPFWNREFEQDNEVRKRTWQFLPSAHYLAHIELNVTGGCSTCLLLCCCLWILTLILALTQNKTARHETISRLCPSAFVRNEVHDEFCQNIRCERRQKNEDGIWIHVSLFSPDQGKNLGQHS